MVYLLYEGQQDAFLTDTPDFTYFKTVFQRNIEHVTRGYEVVYDNQLTADTLICTLPRNGDYVTSVTCKFVLDQLSVPSTNYIFSNPPQGNFYGLNSNNIVNFTVSLLGGAPDTGTLAAPGWFTFTSGISQVTQVGNKFVFTSFTPIQYLVFDSIDIANFWGYSYGFEQLYGGFVRLFVNGKTNLNSQITFHQSGWTHSEITTSYINNVIENLVRSVGLYIGGQLIQEFDPEYIRYVKETTYNYKNRPVMDILENGDTNQVDFQRIYYYSVPFSIIPISAISRQDIQIRVTLNPITLKILNSSIIAEYSIFSVSQLPSNILYKIPQVSYGTGKIKNPLAKLFTPDAVTKVEMNGEFFCDSDYSNVSAYENEFNIPSSNSISINGTMNMSRIRDQGIQSNVHSITTNFFQVKNDIAGILFDQVDSSVWPYKTGPGSVTPVVPLTYVYTMIPNSISSMQCFCSMRLVNPNYKGPVVRLQSGTYVDDFYTDNNQTFLKTQSGNTIDTWHSNPRVIIWYDQTINENHLIQDYDVAPNLILDGSNWIVSFVNIQTNTPLDKYTAGTNWMYFTHFIPSVTQIILNYKQINIPQLDNVSCIFSGVNNNVLIIDDPTHFSYATGSWFWPNYSNLETFNNGFYIQDSVWSNLLTVNDYSAVLIITLADGDYLYSSYYPFFAQPGQRIIFNSDMTGTGLITGLTYYTLSFNQDDQTFQVSTSLGGPPVYVYFSDTRTASIYNDVANGVYSIGRDVFGNDLIGRSFNGHVSEFSLLTGNSLITDYSNYIPMY
jgi:hypothetical protein